MIPRRLLSSLGIPGCKIRPWFSRIQEEVFGDQCFTGTLSCKAELGRDWQRQERARKANARRNAKELKQGYR